MRRISPTLVLAAIAVVLSIGGSAVAAKLITGRQVKDRSLTGADLRSNSVTGRVVSGLSGRDVIPDGLDAADIDEATLDDVASSRHAGRADRAERADVAGTAENAASLDGVRVLRMAYQRAPNSENATVADIGGLRLLARCTGTGALAVTAATSTASGFVRVSTVQPGQNTAETRYSEDDEFRPGDVFDVLPGADDDVTGTLTYVGSDGGVATATFLAESAVTGGRNFTCLFAGTITHAPAG